MLQFDEVTISLGIQEFCEFNSFMAYGWFRHRKILSIFRDVGCEMHDPTPNLLIVSNPIAAKIGLDDITVWGPDSELLFDKDEICPHTGQILSIELGPRTPLLRNHDSASFDDAARPSHESEFRRPQSHVVQFLEFAACNLFDRTDMSSPPHHEESDANHDGRPIRKREWGEQAHGWKNLRLTHAQTPISSVFRP